MSDRKVEYLLIGGGLASANCARWLREEGAEGEVLLVGREPDPPYNRPDCSKGYLRGEESREQPLVRPSEWWSEHDIELLTRTSVTGLDLQARTATLSTKQEVQFDKALIATGANVRRLNVDGCELEHIYYLRTLGNADAIREGVADAEEVVLIGGSYIGCEVAASLKDGDLVAGYVIETRIGVGGHAGEKGFKGRKPASRSADADDGEAHSTCLWRLRHRRRDFRRFFGRSVCGSAPAFTLLEVPFVHDWFPLWLQRLL